MNQQLKDIIDTYLSKWIDSGLNLFVNDPLVEMLDQKTASEKLPKWLPIDSRVDQDDILKLEKRIGHQLPPSYINFLKYKHFIELYIGQVCFISHPSKGWDQCIINTIFNGYPQEYLIDKKLIPFANYNDWGLLCFDLNNCDESNEPEIALWDHEMPDDIEFMYFNFNQMLISLDEEVDQNN